MKSRLILAILLITTAAQSQQPTPANTITQLNTTIATTAGFTLPQDSGTLTYSTAPAAPCHLSWSPHTTGSDELSINFPPILNDEDLGAIQPNTVTLQPVSLDELNLASTAEPTLLKLTAQYQFHLHKDDVAFSILFSNSAAAHHVADTLTQAINLCAGPNAAANHVAPPPPQQSQCDTVNQQVTLDITTARSSVRDEFAGRTDSTTIVLANHNNFPLTCAIHYHRNSDLDTKTLTVIDLLANQTLSLDTATLPKVDPLGMGGNLPPAAEGSWQIRCYHPHAVDQNNQACTTHLW